MRTSVLAASLPSPSVIFEECSSVMKTMKAVCLTADRTLELKTVPAPEEAAAEHLIIDMKACAINPGDKAWIGGAFPPGTTPESSHAICGVSGAGTVVDAGDRVPPEYNGRNVAVYRSLRFSDHMVGTWCEYAQMHYQHCVILPDDARPEDYSGSLVNTITPYAFLKQIAAEGHEGVMCTAGTSATGRALLGICLAHRVPLLSVVRSEESKRRLLELGACDVLVQDAADFDTRLRTLSAQLNATAVFDGVGGELISRVANALPRGASIYVYGFLGGKQPLSVHTSTVLMNGLTIKGFGILTSETVRNPEQLEKALNGIQAVIGMPHFKTDVGRRFALEDIDAAMQYTSDHGEKAVLCPCA